MKITIKCFLSIVFLSKLNLLAWSSRVCLIYFQKTKTSRKASCNFTSLDDWKGSWWVMSIYTFIYLAYVYFLTAVWFSSSKTTSKFWGTVKLKGEKCERHFGERNLLRILANLHGLGSRIKTRQKKPIVFLLMRHDIAVGTIWLELFMTSCRVFV